ncbi:MAG: hypothetical protein J6S85_05855 [Methanobrevibacter sp.]|nr:hypothetical protein [Methanobrevibacter sp.]
MKESKKRHFNFYGYLWPLSFEEYCSSVLYWMYEDEAEDRTIIVRNIFSGELRYVEGSELE